MDANGVRAVALTDETFQKEIAPSTGLWMVDFGAAWCAPCRLVAPIVEQLAGDYAGRLKIGTVEVDANPRTAARFGIRNLPTFLFFRDGAVVETVVGAVPRQILEGKIQRHL